MSLALLVSSLTAVQVTELVVRECLPDGVAACHAQPQGLRQVQAAGFLMA
jgi:hypothetical protein